MDTLVLSDSYIPMNRIAWKRAVSNVLSGRAEVLEFYADRAISMAGGVIFQMPSVIRFVRKVKGLFRRKRFDFNRKNVWSRDNGRCQYCSEQVQLSEMTYDHVIPRSQGGETEWTNIVVACQSCNQAKKNRTPAQAGMKLLRLPVKPDFIKQSFLPISFDEVPETWKDYLASYQYWHGQLAGPC